MSKERVALWDNARFGAIALMVAGHTLTKMVGENDSAFALYIFIYAFHVPVFVAVSGYFSRTNELNSSKLKAIVTDIIAPYLIFEFIWSVVYFLYNVNYSFDLTRASWTLWFLLALAIWRIILPYLALLRFPLLISVIISLAAGYYPIDQTFSAARVLGFLPFFVLGWKLKEWQWGEKWLALSPKSISVWRTGAISFFVVIIVLISLNVSWLREIQLRRFLTFDAAYASFGYTEWWAGGVRLSCLALGTAMILAFLMLIPQKTTWFTQFGTATMYVYLLHTFVLYPLREYGILDGERPLWYIIVAILFSFALTVALSTRPIRKIFRPLVQPKLDWLFVTSRDVKH